MCSAKGFRGDAGSLADLHEMRAKYLHCLISVTMERDPNEEGLDPGVFGSVPHWAENAVKDYDDYLGPYPMVFHLDDRHEYRDYMDDYSDCDEYGDPHRSHLWSYLEFNLHN